MQDPIQNMAIKAPQKGFSVSIPTTAAKIKKMIPVTNITMFFLISILAIHPR